MRNLLLATIVIGLSFSAAIVHAEDSSFGATTTQQGTTGPSGSQIVNKTSNVPLYNSGNTSVGGYSSTTVTGGASTNGSGNPIPNGTVGSTSSTTYGVGVTIKTP
jgi:hypothetical protein